MQFIRLISHSSIETESIAERIGQNLKGNEVIELSSDLGGGKTTFTKGLAKGFGYKGKVSSPTFTISNFYQVGDKGIIHYDFYRLDPPGIMGNVLSEEIAESSYVIVIEWSGIVQTLLPKHIVIDLKPVEENERQITIKYLDGQEYLIKGLTS